MSSDIYSKPDLSHKVRYSRKAEEDDVEWTVTCIYESTDDMKDYTPQPQEEGETIQIQPAVKKKAVRRATLCTGLLFILVLVGYIFLYIHFTVEINNLNYSYSLQLQELLFNNSQIQRSHNNLTEEIIWLKKMRTEKWCPEGWMRFGCKCYFKSTETKSWYSSRTDCQDKRADLVIIDTEEEQEFIVEINMNGESWIGLEGDWMEAKNAFAWKWVDGSLLTKKFWDKKLQTASSIKEFATCCSPEGKWKHSYNSVQNNWICEKYIKITK